MPVLLERSTIVYKLTIVLPLFEMVPGLVVALSPLYHPAINYYMTFSWPSAGRFPLGCPFSVQAIPHPCPKPSPLHCLTTTEYHSHNCDSPRQSVFDLNFSQIFAKGFYGGFLIFLMFHPALCLNLPSDLKLLL